VRKPKFLSFREGGRALISIENGTKWFKHFGCNKKTKVTVPITSADNMCFNITLCSRMQLQKIRLSECNGIVPIGVVDKKHDFLKFLCQQF
jgi:hypothetical protein